MKKLLLVLLALTMAVTLTVWAADSTPVELTGKIGCSHCTYKLAVKGCGVALKTDDGKIYVVDNPTPELKKARFDGGTLKVKGTVTEKAGIQYIHTSSAELTK